MTKAKRGRRNAMARTPWKPRWANRAAAGILAALTVLVACIAWQQHLRATPPTFGKLAGRWVRPDGGYVVHIRRVARDGAIDAAYYNPNPIHVSQAKASREGDSTKVFIELRDTNYPGSNYTLTYDPESDQLRGIYYQAIQGQRYEVFFARESGDGP